MKDNVSTDRLKELKSRLKNYDELQKEYDLSDEQQSTRAVLRRMAESLEGYIKILMQLLQPEEYFSLHECSAFDDKDKEGIFEIYKNLMITHREILKAELLDDEKGNVSTINYVHQEVKKMKPKMLAIVVKMQDSWKKPIANGTAKYFG